MGLGVTLKCSCQPKSARYESVTLDEAKYLKGMESAGKELDNLYYLHFGIILSWIAAMVTNQPILSLQRWLCLRLVPVAHVRYRVHALCQT